MAVFDDFKQAWREAVDNFWHELEGDDTEASSRSALRQVAAARNQLETLDGAIGDTRQRVAHEQEQVEACRRREGLARGIGDEETARIAGEYGARHQERADVLTRKLEALEAERRLCRRDLQDMEKAIQEGRIAGAQAELEDLNRHPSEDEFRNLEDAARGRSADERLEELKRRMRER
jgi:ABC-type phosphate transport system auxiliary subunit